MLFAYIQSAYEMVLLHVVRLRLFYVWGTTALFGIAVFTWMLMPPFSFPRNSIIEIPEDASLPVIAEQLEREHVIRSAFMLRVVARLTGADTGIQSGKYLFKKPLCALSVLYRIENGEHGIPTVRVTFPEGYTAREMGELLANKVPGITKEDWNSAVKEEEGYLFPDTYDFTADTSVESAIKRMRENFEAKTATLQSEENAHSFDEIVTMASLIEKEANTHEDRLLVSGILWNRIKIKMALQVDATFGYIRGISGYVPTGDDPETLTSLYNTYQNRDLPPGAIGNPGMDALEAAAHPAKTDYLYYLTGKDGKMYYAKTFEEHKRNQRFL